LNRTTLYAGVAAAGLALSTITPSFAQATPALGSWLAGPDGAGASTIIGRVETPRPRQSVSAGANVLVSGWAADLTAAGWAGIDGIEVWNGAKDKGGTKLSTGMVALTRADVGEFLGGNFTRSGFSAVIPNSALQGLKAAPTLYVYLHTPGKGTWMRTVDIGVAAAPAMAFPNDPILGVVKPQDGTSITQLQRFSKFTFSGFALDRNPITNPATQTLGPGCSACTLFANQARGAGINSVTGYIDSPRATDGNGGYGTITGSLYGTPLVSNLGVLNVPGRSQASIITRQYGNAFDYSGWSMSVNPTQLSPGPHTLTVTATSSITGKQSTATINFNVLDLSHTRIQP